jgi:hypothetical protein
MVTAAGYGTTNATQAACEPAAAVSRLRSTTVLPRLMTELSGSGP